MLRPYPGTMTLEPRKQRFSIDYRIVIQNMQVPNGNLIRPPSHAQAPSSEISVNKESVITDDISRAPLINNPTVTEHVYSVTDLQRQVHSLLYQ